MKQTEAEDMMLVLAKGSLAGKCHNTIKAVVTISGCTGPKFLHHPTWAQRFCLQDLNHSPPAYSSSA